MQYPSVPNVEMLSVLVQWVRKMAFSEIFDGLLSSGPTSLGVVESNIFLVQGNADSIWAKVRIGVYTQIQPLGLVEIANTYVPVGDGRLVMAIVPVPVDSLPPPLLAFAEVVYRYSREQAFPCKIFSGGIEDMIYDPINPGLIAEAGATRSEVSSDITNVSPTAVVPVRAPNPNRTGGFLSWNETGTIYIGFGGPPAKKPTSLLARGSKIDIPDGFIGDIFVDWNGNQVAPNAPAGQIKTLQCIEYLR